MTSNHLILCRSLLLLPNLLLPIFGNAKECSNYCTIALISHTSKVMLKILQARLQQYVNHELPDVQAGFREGRGTRDQVASIHWIIEKSKRVTEKHLFLLYWLCQSFWLYRSQKNCGKFFKKCEYQTTWHASWKICTQVKKQQLELDMEKQTGSKWGKEYVRAVYCHPANKLICQLHHAKCQPGGSTSWNQNCQKKYQ